MFLDPIKKAQTFLGISLKNPPRKTRQNTKKQMLKGRLGVSQSFDSSAIFFIKTKYFQMIFFDYAQADLFFYRFFITCCLTAD